MNVDPKVKFLAQFVDVQNAPTPELPLSIGHKFDQIYTPPKKHWTNQTRPNATDPGRKYNSTWSDSCHSRHGRQYMTWSLTLGALHSQFMPSLIHHRLEGFDTCSFSGLHQTTLNRASKPPGTTTTTHYPLWLFPNGSYNKNRQAGSREAEFASGLVWTSDLYVKIQPLCSQSTSTD